MSRPRDWSPLRAADPVGGDPQAIAALARRYADTAAAISDASAALHRIHDSATAWDSDAGRVFRDRTSDTAGAIQQAFDRYDRTAAALSRYADELASVQTRADAQLRRAQEDDDEARAAHRGRLVLAAAVQPDPQLEAQLVHREAAAADGVAAAGRQLTALEHEWADAGSRAARAIEDVTSGDGLDDSWWDDVLDVVSLVTDLAGLLSTAFGVISLVCSVLPGLQEFAPLFAGLSLVTGAVALAGHLLLAANGRATVGEVLGDLVGVLTFGAGRAFRLAGKAMATGARGLAKPAMIRALRAGGATGRDAMKLVRSSGVTSGGRAARQLAGRAGRTSGIWPTRAEWATAYRPSSLFRDVATGAVPRPPADTHLLPEVSAALRRSRVARGLATASTGVDNSVQGIGVAGWASGGPSSPVPVNR